MLIVKPIQTKEEQENACTRCGVTYFADSMAYGAYIDSTFIGVCQFSVDDEYGYIKNLAEAKGVDDFEAMFIMGRATMNFIDTCGIHKVYCAPKETSERIMLAIGFKRQSDGSFLADMTGMFDGSHCAGEKNEK